MTDSRKEVQLRNYKNKNGKIVMKESKKSLKSINSQQKWMFFI